jgi:hypothetical protein
MECCIPACRRYQTYLHMKYFILIAFASLLLVVTCEASLLIGIPMPFDYRSAKLAIETNSITAKQIQADRQQYDAIEEQLRKLPESRLKVLFGASQDTIPKGYALPAHHSDSVGFSGLGYEGGGRSYFIPIADLGGLLVFPLGRDDYVSSVTLYLKTDAGFIALRSSADYPARRAWDLRHTEVVRKHIQGVLGK